MTPNARPRRLLRSGAALALIAVLAGSGCRTHQAYPGPAKPAREIAILHVPDVSKVVLDGEAISLDGADRIAMLPGAHSIEWMYVYPNRFLESRELDFDAEAGRRYRLDQRFFPAPNPGGLVGALFDAALDTLLAPINLLVPQTPTGPPDGESYVWIGDAKTKMLVAGSPPDAPTAHAPITWVPPDDVAGEP
jgi:hypothetical protein